MNTCTCTYTCPPNLQTNEKSKIWQTLTSWNQTKQKTALTSQNLFLKEITKKAPNRGPHNHFHKELAKGVTTNMI